MKTVTRKIHQRIWDLPEVTLKEKLFKQHMKNLVWVLWLGKTLKGGREGDPKRTYTEGSRRTTSSK